MYLKSAIGLTKLGFFEILDFTSASHLGVPSDLKLNFLYLEIGLKEVHKGESIICNGFMDSM